MSCLQDFTFEAAYHLSSIQQSLAEHCLQDHSIPSWNTYRCRWTTHEAQQRVCVWACLPITISSSTQTTQWLLSDRPWTPAAARQTAKNNKQQQTNIIHADRQTTENKYKTTKMHWQTNHSAAVATSISFEASQCSVKICFHKMCT